jgi:hypothetical protein
VKTAGLVAMAALLAGPWDTAVAGNRGERVDDFIARIARIKTAIGDLTSTGGLRRLEEFREVHAQPQAYRDAAIGALEEPALGEEEKVIAALSMQRLPLPEFLAFAERALELLEGGRLTETVFQHAVFPTYDWNTALAEEYAAPAVQRFLERVLASPAVNDRRKQIVKDVLLTGTARTSVLEMREAGEIK